MYKVQVDSFQFRKGAEELVERLRNAGFSAFIIEDREEHKMATKCKRDMPPEINLPKPPKEKKAPKEKSHVNQKSQIKIPHTELSVWGILIRRGYGEGCLLLLLHWYTLLRKLLHL